MNHKPLRPSEASYILEAGINGCTVADILHPEAVLRQDVKAAIANGDESIPFKYKGRIAVNVMPQTLADLKAMHGIDGIKEVIAALESEYSNTYRKQQ